MSDIVNFALIVGHFCIDNMYDWALFSDEIKLLGIVTTFETCLIVTEQRLG